MAKPSLNIQSTGSIQIMSNATNTQSNTSQSNTSQNEDPEEIHVNIKKPNIAKLTAEALNTTAQFVETIGNGTEESINAANVMRKSAKVAETIPTAVAGIKREAKPAINAISNLWNALEDSGVVGVRDKVNIAEMRKKP